MNSWTGLFGGGGFGLKATSTASHLLLKAQKRGNSAIGNGGNGLGVLVRDGSASYTAQRGIQVAFDEENV